MSSFKSSNKQSATCSPRVPNTKMYGRINRVSESKALATQLRPIQIHS